MDLSTSLDLQSGFHELKGGLSSPVFKGIVRDVRHDRRVLKKALATCRDRASLIKALTTGDGIVQDQDTGGRALRRQYLDDKLQEVSFKEDHAVTLKTIGTIDVSSTAVEWSDFGQYGGPGDGFTAEDGDDGDGNVSIADDQYQRQVANIKYMATQRNITEAASRVRGISKPEKTAMMGATRWLRGRANLAIFDGNALTQAAQFNGIIEQTREWCTRHPEDQAIMFDANGGPINQGLANELAETNNKLYGSATQLIQSTVGYGDTNREMFPNQRGPFGGGGPIGGDHRKVMTGFSEITRLWDPMLRPNSPLTPDGLGSDGKPRDSSSADAGALAFASTPYTTIPVGNVTPGAGLFYNYANVNTDTAVLGTVPALPSGPNQSVHLTPGSYYVAIAPVYKGKEGLPWVYGASAAGTVTGATAVTLGSGKVIQIDVDLGSITGLGTTYARRNTKFRVYLTTAAPGAVSNFDYAFDIGCPTAGNARGFHNGMFIPGADRAFLITPETIKMCVLAPLYPVDLPRTALMRKKAYIWMLTLVDLMPRKNIWIRNIGRSTAAG